MFQLTAARRRLENHILYIIIYEKFQLTAARRRLGIDAVQSNLDKAFQLTAARRRLGAFVQGRMSNMLKFQLTAARRRLVKKRLTVLLTTIVSTHSRPKAAGSLRAIQIRIQMFQLTAARRRLAAVRAGRLNKARFNSQPPEGGWTNIIC